MLYKKFQAFSTCLSPGRINASVCCRDFMEEHLGATHYLMNDKATHINAQRRRDQACLRSLDTLHMQQRCTVNSNKIWILLYLKGSIEMV